MNSKAMRTTAAVVFTGTMVLAGSAGTVAAQAADGTDCPGSGPQTARAGAGAGAGAAAAGVAGQTSVGALTSAQQKALVHLAEEEKLAHDIYVLAYREYGLRVFANIAAAETRHEAAMVRLLARYGIADPTDGSSVGTFADEDLQALYDKLAKRVMKSETAALKVGKKIERLDIKDLKTAKAGAPAAVDRVLSNLLAGSRNHLRAFTAWLAR